jgi:methylthioribulose-1-phosphate dehydratase
VSIRADDRLYIAPSGVQKELLTARDLFVQSLATAAYERVPMGLKPSACTPLFRAAFTLRGAGCCIHTHSPHAVLVTLLCEKMADKNSDVFEIQQLEQIKGVPAGYDVLDGDGKVVTHAGNLGYHDRLRVPIIENTAKEENLRETLEDAIRQWPDASAVLVRRHGM